MRVLVVEDDDAIAEPLVELLEREGFSPVRVSTVRAALASSPADIAPAASTSSSSTSASRAGAVRTC